MKSIKFVSLFLVAGVLALSACAAKPTRTADTHYGLDITIAETSFGTDETVSLRRVDIRGVQSGRSLVHIVSDNPPQYQEARGNFWHVATPTLLGRAFDDALQQASTDARFGTNETVQDADYSYSVDVETFAFEPNGEARVAATIVVKDAKRNIVLSEQYSATAVVTSNTPTAGVEALSNALSEAIGLFASDLANAI